jgi:outer membrane protein with glycine zipper
MKLPIAVAAAALLFVPALAQTQPPSGKTLAATMNVYAFPNKGQSPETQSTDEAACYDYATKNVGTDPFALQKQSDAQAAQTEAAKQQAAQAGKGAGVKGAVGGAAAGALVGEIASDDAGEGAAIGAAAGAVHGRRKAKRAQGQATAQAEAQGQQAQHATAAQLDNFKKAFSVCLEAKGYMVKY